MNTLRKKLDENEYLEKKIDDNECLEKKTLDENEYSATQNAGSSGVKK